MDLAHYAAQAVLTERRSLRDVARATGRSKSWVQRQVVRCSAGGPDALALRKRGPRTSPIRTSAEVEDLVCRWRKHLADQGFDAGAATIRYHLAQSLEVVPTVRTVHRILVRRGFVSPQPHKRPRSSWIRFESDLPNECWQSDMTHWRLADETPVEVTNFIDDYSRAALSSVVRPVTTAADVSEQFFATAEVFGLPAEVLSDNGCIYTTIYRGSHTGLEVDLAALGITFKHGKPYHPTTQGKVERFHQTLKKWLRKQPGAATIADLQRQIDWFVTYYNETRPHTARGCPPMHAWRSLDKAAPRLDGVTLSPSTRVRRDRVDRSGAFTLRHNGRLHHVAIGRAHKGKRLLVLVADLDVRVLDIDGTMLRHFQLDPSVIYQALGRNNL